MPPWGSEGTALLAVRELGVFTRAWRQGAMHVGWQGQTAAWRASQVCLVAAFSQVYVCLLQYHQTCLQSLLYQNNVDVSVSDVAARPCSVRGSLQDTCGGWQ